MKRLVFVITALVFTLSSIFAGTTGKIAGRVVDARTKEPLVGANVYLKGTNFGASTDQDGEFYIINIPVGTYTIIAVYVGYRSIEHQGVRVILDQTTVVNFEMSEEIVEGETIVVTATPFKVQKDETSKKITIQADEIQSMPVQDFSDLVVAQAGVIQIESSVQGIAGFEDRGIEEIHVRGGRSGEIGYTIDGTYIVNPFYGAKYSWTELNDFAVEQVDMKTGVFDAEYGGALSSMINIITRDGGEKLEGNLRFYTSNPANLANLHEFTVDPESRLRLAPLKQDYLRDYREISGGLGGPVPGTNKKVRFIVTGSRLATAYRVYEFDYVTFDKTQDQFSEHNRYLNKLDTIAGWHQMGFRYSWDLYGKLSWRISNAMKLTFSNWNLKTTFRTANLSNYSYQYYEAGRNINTQTSDRQALTFNHQLSRKTFYDVRLSRFYQKMFIGVTDNGNYDGRYLRPDEYERPGFDEDWQNNPYWYEYYIKGHDRYYHTNYAETYEAIINVLSQVTKHHQLKAGVDYRRHTIFIDEIQLPWLLTPYVEKYKRHPEELAFYVQDLLEYEYMTIHLGMRVDLLNAHSKYWKNPYAPADERELVDSGWEVSYSPRISFSHVITENATFTFGYGQFTQTPTYRNKYINPNRDLKTYSPLVGNAGLSMEKMTAYEFGLNVGVTDNLIAQVIGWSKEYSGLTSTERVPQFPYSYTIFLNTDYATARGMDVVIRRRGSNSNFVLQYTLSRATANRKDPWEGYRETDTPRTMPKREILMSYDRTHDFSILYSYRLHDKQGPGLFGVYPLQKTSFDLMFLAMSGAPYTPVIGNVAGETNSERGPWNLTTNFNFRRFFNVGDFRLIFGIRVQNLFDWKNPIDIYPETGKADDPGPRINELIEMGWFSRTLWDQPYRYGRRRQIDFSLEIAF
ncbi:TonB-dependent receptor [Caldithrix abyssi]